MIFQSPKKLLSVAKAFPPVTWRNLSPTRFFTSNAPLPREESLVDPPTWPAELPRDEFWEDGGPIQPTRRLKRCYGNNGSFHHSLYLKQLQANQTYCGYLKKRARYQDQQAKLKEFADRTRPLPLGDLIDEARRNLGGSTDNEDLIFMAELERMRNQPSNLDKLEEKEAQDEYADLLARDLRPAPSFSTFQRKRKETFVRAAAAKRTKRQKVQRMSTMEEKFEERLERERKRKELEEDEERRRDQGRAYAQKIREKIHHEEIRLCLEQNRSIPAHLQQHQGLIQEITQQFAAAAQFKELEAQRRVEQERVTRLARELEAQRQAEAARRQAQFEARTAALEAAQLEQRRKEQEVVEHRRAEKAAWQEQARRAREEAARQAQEGARRRAAEQKQTRLSALVREPATILERYDAKWAALRSEVYVYITFEFFPWPILGVASDISAITLDAVKAFYTLHGISAKSMKAEILKWHPDKLQNQLHQVHPEHRERVREAGELVAKFLNNIKSG